MEEVIVVALKGHNKTIYDVLYEAEAATLVRIVRQQRTESIERIEFTHQLIQEFFAAYALHREGRWGEAVAHCEDPWWWETLFMLGGLTATPEAGGSPERWVEFTQRVMPDGQNDMRVFAAIGLLRSVESPEAEVSRTVLGAFAASVSKSLTPGQQDAARKLEGILGDEAVEIFAAMFRDPDPHLKAKGAALLCAVGKEQAMEILLNALRAPNERKAAFQAFVSTGALAIEALTFVLRKEEGVRKEAAEALAKIGPSAVEPLIAALRDRDEDVRQWAAGALGKIGDARAVEPLSAALKDTVAGVREWAAWALGKIGDARAVEPLIAALDVYDEGLVGLAAEVLGEIGDARALPRLKRVAEGYEGEMFGKRLAAVADEAIEKIRKKNRELGE